jgi:hypothetical protein
MYAVCFSFLQKRDILGQQEIIMGIRVKPVQPTVIRDKAIIKQVIAEIHRHPSPERLAEMEKHNKIIMSMVKKNK